MILFSCYSSSALNFWYSTRQFTVLTGLLAARNLLGEKHDLWQVNTERSYYEEFTLKPSQEKAKMAVGHALRRAFDKVHQSDLSLSAAVTWGTLNGNKSTYTTLLCNNKHMIIKICRVGAYRRDVKTVFSECNGARQMRPASMTQLGSKSAQDCVPKRIVGYF